MTGRKTWVLTDGKAGTRAGAMGLAEAVGLPIVEKHVHSRLPWRWLPPQLWPPGVLGVGAGGDPLEPPWPDLLISAGERAVGPALEIRRRGGGATLAVHIQHPRIAAGRFDLVVVSAHDRLSGPNVRVTLGALHRVNRVRLDEAGARFAAQFAALPRPWTAVLIGGANRTFRFDRAVATDLAERLATAAAGSGGSLLVTASRRTGAANEALLRERLAGLPVAFWDGTGENPYFAYLALADTVVVTSDSVNMVSEALYTGRPVHVYRLPGGEGSKFDRFHRALADAGYTRPFTGRLERWDYPPLDEGAALAGEIRRKLAGSTGAD